MSTASKATSRIATVGIDIGADTTHIALVRSGAVHVLQNEEGSRKTPTYVSFPNNQTRLYGSSAKSAKSSNMNSTFSNFFHSLDTSDNINTNITFNHKDFNINDKVLISSFLSYLYNLCEKNSGGAPVENCVIAIPDNWTIKQRNIFQQLCKLSGWNPLSLPHRSSAIAYFYGFFHRKLNDNFQYTMFIDMGHTHCTISLASFKKEQIVIKARKQIDFGGKHVDEIIYNKIVHNLKEKNNIIIKDNTKASLLVLKQANRIKHILSANQSANYIFEYIQDQYNVKGTLTRKDLEDILVPKLKDNFQSIISNILDKIPNDKVLHNIEIVGGGIRIPCIQSYFLQEIHQITKLDSLKLSKTCDGDESVVRGCALLCASLSTSFNTHKLKLIDCNHYNLSLKWGNKSDEHLLLFAKNSKLPIVKKIPFKKKNDFTISFF